MLFISKLLNKQQESLSVVKLVDERLKGWEEQRTHRIVHISDLSKSIGFCPREFALLDVTKKKPKGMYVSTALRVAFDNGSALSDLVRNRWLENDVVGHWKCAHCKKLIEFSKKPKVACGQCGARLWQYVEVAIVNPHNGVTGSIDFLIDFGTGKHVMIECKSMAVDMFNDLKAPLAEHRIRTQLYLYHWSQTPGLHAGKVDAERAIVFYISKGYGTKSEESGKVLPFKEFIVERDDKAVLGLYARGDALSVFRKGGPMPSGICANSFDKRGKSCPVMRECWSGQFPAGV